MKSHHWIMFGSSAFIAAVLIMATILITGLIVGSGRAPETELNVIVPAPDVYDLGPKSYFIKIDSLRPSDKIKSPLTITGQARLWYFEGSFPVVLKDANGAVLTTGIAQAQGDWMSEAMVPFVATLTFGQPSTPTGVLILKKDNPSGLPQYDDQVELPVNF